MFTSFFAVIFAGAARIIETSSAFTTTGTAFLWFPEKETLFAFCTVTFFMVPLFLIATVPLLFTTISLTVPLFTTAAFFPTTRMVTL